MKRKDIKRGTILVIVVSVVAFTAISLLVKRPQKTEEVAEARTAHAWSDTLRNSMSSLPQLAGMDADIERFMGRWSIKGMSLAVVRHDSLLYAKGYGWADEESDRPMEANSIMRIASASKLVTAVAVMKLVERGHLTLDTKVFGPDGVLSDTSYTAAMRNPRLAEITVDNLLQHRGGFSNRGGDPMFNTVEIMKAKGLDHAPSSEELIRIVLSRGLGGEPGRTRRYSNFGYMLLSKVIEKVSGMSYWDFMQKEVLQPAGACNFRPATNYYAQRHPGEVRYYPTDDELKPEYTGSGRMVSAVYGASDYTGLLGAGGWVASAADLARLVSAIDGDPGVNDILSEGSIRALTQYDEKENVSRGWARIDRDGKWVRTGTLNSTRALVEYTPDGQCWVMITNSGVWNGDVFARSFAAFMERLRARYASEMPVRDLW